MSEDRYMPHASRDALYTARRQAFVADLDRLADNLYKGRITLGMWEEDVRTRLREYLVGSASIGKGGRHLMTSSDWGKVGNELRKQYRWLHQFAKDVYVKKDVVTLNAIKARSHLYADSGAKLANWMQAGSLLDYLPWLPRDGSTSCLNNCGCKWVLTVENSEATAESSVMAVWTVDPSKEHCEPKRGLDGCNGRDGYTVTFMVPPGADIPSYIGVG